MTEHNTHPGMLSLAQALIDLHERSQHMEEKAFLTYGLDVLCALTGSAIAYLHFINTDQETIELVTWSSGTHSQCTAAYDNHYPISRAGIWADSFRTRQAVVHNDYASTPNKRGMPEGHFPLIRHAGVPVIEQDRVVALVGIGNKPTDYSDDDIALLQLFANALWRHASHRRTQQAMQQHLRQSTDLLNASGEGIYGIDLSGNITFINPAARSMLGFSDDEDLLGRHSHSLFHHHHADGSPYPAENCPNYRTLHQCTPQQEHEDTFWRTDGTPISVTNFSYPILKEDGSCTGAVVHFHDISTHKAQQQAQKLAAAVFENAGEGIIITNEKGQILQVNQAFCDITGYSIQEAVGHTPALLSSGHHDAHFYQTLWQSLQTDGRWCGEIINRRKSGEIYPEWLSITSVHNDTGLLTHYIGVFSDITERKQQEARIQHLAQHDALTGLPNRMQLSEAFHQLLSLSLRENKKLALLFLDLDRFKWINDSLGHQVGDELLIAVSQRLKDSLRDSDVVGRLGGDEFIILLPMLDSAREASQVANKVLQALSDDFSIGHHQLHTSFSIGITLAPNDGRDFSLLLRHADNAMYHAKSSGRNTFRFFNKHMNESAQQRLQLETALRHAVSAQQLSLHFQPQLDIHGQVTGAEALLRWHHPTMGNIPPDQFIPIAEESGHIRTIGQWVLETACQQLADWNRQGLVLDKLAVNVSLMQLHDRQFTQRLNDLLTTHNLSASQLMLEFTESQLAREITQLHDQLVSIKTMGLLLSIDDFGTGYSNLGQLKQLHVDQLKIDKSFVRDATHDSEDNAIIRAIIQMAHSLQLTTIAEGVETEEQWRLLRDMQCDNLQGFHFYRPLTAEQMTELLRGNTTNA